ncbi:MAG: hypothetical protein Ct9H300mP25_10250 [Acidobacteriota bacterium]|nr:MAG: hypothetical protein Ct9H300mP25_10250 [Acidobacteriota bacterium]
MTDGEVDTLLGAYREGRGDGGFDAGIERGLETLLAMPQFLCVLMRVPSMPKPVASMPSAIWSLRHGCLFSMAKPPDEELIDLGVREALSRRSFICTGGTDVSRPTGLAVHGRFCWSVATDA